MVGVPVDQKSMKIFWIYRVSHIMAILCEHILQVIWRRKCHVNNSIELHTSATV